MRIVFLLLFSIFFLSSCSSKKVIVRSHKPIKNFTIDQGGIYKSSEKTIVVKVPDGFGNVEYEAMDMRGKKITGIIKRHETNTVILTSSVLITTLTLPLMAAIGALVVNPQWVYASTTALTQDHFWSYASQTASVYTLPSAFFFGILGSLPMLGLLISEEASDFNLRLNW